MTSLRRQSSTASMRLKRPRCRPPVGQEIVVVELNCSRNGPVTHTWAGRCVHKWKLAADSGAFHCKARRRSRRQTSKRAVTKLVSKVILPWILRYDNPGHLTVPDSLSLGSKAACRSDAAENGHRSLSGPGGQCEQYRLSFGWNQHDFRPQLQPQLADESGITAAFEWQHGGACRNPALRRELHPVGSGRALVLAHGHRSG